ncbi:hypothetical protein HAHE_18040 [Haloferula helveola]|uniref:Uncharacterized protein n=1 Tax=Haloferula helveola TaxID=490095 RepID=A0ABM7R9I4_9BACT|nr:hypothetical protein HAHE_18040 [Haloferula helveola]
MKAAPTLDGRIRVDLETDLDLLVLRSIIADAQGGGSDLATRLSGKMDASLADDWSDFVLPELRGEFNAQLEVIAKALGPLEPGQPLFIERPDAELWYGGLNQARLSLEARFGFGNEELEAMPPDKRSARIRSHFYQVLQGLLLDFLMRE